MAKVYPCGGIGKHIGGCSCSDADESLPRRRRQKREQKPAERGKPPITDKEELEWVPTDCPKCKGAKAGPWGRNGKVITCPECNGKGKFMTQQPKKK